MKPRKEYEDILDKSYTLSSEAVPERIKIDLLLDIRDMLQWFRDREMFKDVVKAREEAESKRISISKEVMENETIGQ